MDTARAILQRKGGDVASIETDATVGHAADMMSSGGIGALIVVDGERVVGIITERDLVTKVLAARRSPDEVKIQEVMTSNLTCCQRSTSLTECRAVMTDMHIRHLPVVEDGRLFGLISSRDVMAAEVLVRQGTIDHLERTTADMGECLYSGA
jgi:CBS domain-containing protein